MDATLQEHLARAGKVAAVLKKHGADMVDIAGDAAKLIEIAGDLHAALKEGDAQAAATAAVPSAPRPLEQLPVKITAQQAAKHVEKHGLTGQQRTVFDREAQSFG